MAQMANQKAQTPSDDMSAGLLTFFGLVLVAGVFVLGYSYAYGYYRSFGIDVNEAGLSYHALVVWGLGLMRNPWVLIYSLVAAIVSAVLLRWVHHRWWVSLSVAAALFILLGFGATILGLALGIEGAEKITFSGEGRVAYCVLHKNTDLPKRFRDLFMKLTKKHQIRLVLRTSDITYLVPVLTRQPGGFHGQSLLLRNEDIAYCRILGVATNVGS